MIVTFLVLFHILVHPCIVAFQPAIISSFGSRVQQTSFHLQASVGGGSGAPRPPRDDGENKRWDDFLDPNKKESENLQRAREYLSDNSLPISFDMDAFKSTGSPEESKAKDEENGTDSTSLVPSKGGSITTAEFSGDIMSQNPYIATVARLTPSELISRFTATANPSVQNAVRSTILGLIGGLPKMAFDTTTVTTGQRLASLMFQLQMTGYMFKNAEYKLSMQHALGMDEEVEGQLRLKGTEGDTVIDPLKGKIRGKLRVRFPSSTTTTTATPTQVVSPSETNATEASGIEVDAAAYMSELRAEVSKLRDELMTTRKTKEEALRKDLLLYIRTLPEKELRSLTNTMSPDVLVAMKGLVGAVLAGIGDGQIGPDTVTEQSAEAMAQLCMWQLAIGYNLRTLEVREEIKKSIQGIPTTTDADEPESGVDLSQPDALQ